MIPTPAWLIRLAVLAAFAAAVVLAGACDSMKAPTAPDTPIISLFVAEPATVKAGTPTTLRWDVSAGNAEVRIDPGVGNVPATGNASVSPLVTTTYTLNARNGPSSAQRVLTVVVTP